MAFHSSVSACFALFSSEHLSKLNWFFFSSVFMFCHLSSPIQIPPPEEQGSCWTCSLLPSPGLKMVPGTRGHFRNSFKWINVLMNVSHGPKLSGSQNEGGGIWEDAYQCFRGKKAFENKHLILTDCYCTEALFNGYWLMQWARPHILLQQTWEHKSPGKWKE